MVVAIVDEDEEIDFQELFNAVFRLRLRLGVFFHVCCCDWADILAF